ncbi:hypothetical protein CYY_002771 [Polysphondylium violaceum]|uniref:Ras guanine nucleotide exchange factor n=1 Tax=Polysphondylium violaceum TaxID=133409 RepID=A0A8J4PXL7_9MYCE|nr:hypothetical protein CYY_002771 [Polysphondylium violaceum]
MEPILPTNSPTSPTSNSNTGTSLTSSLKNIKKLFNKSNSNSRRNSSASNSSGDFSPVVCSDDHQTPKNFTWGSQSSSGNLENISGGFESLDISNHNNNSQQQQQKLNHLKYSTDSTHSGISSSDGGGSLQNSFNRNSIDMMDSSKNGLNFLSFLKNNILLSSSSSSSPSSNSSSRRSSRIFFNNNSNSSNNNNNNNIVGIHQIPRSHSVFNLKSDQNNSSSSSSNNGNGGPGPLERQRSFSQQLLPSWETVSYEGDFSNIINDTLSKALSNNKLSVANLGQLKSSSEITTPTDNDSDNDSDDEELMVNTNRSTNATGAIASASAPMNNADIIFKDNGEILSGKLDSILDYITDISKVTGTQFLEEFLYTYHNFTTPTELMEKLINRFDHPDHSQSSITPSSFKDEKDREQFISHVRFRVINILKKWIENHSYTFVNQQLYGQLIEFIDFKMIDFNSKWGNYLKKALSETKFVLRFYSLNKESSKSLRSLVSLDNLETISKLLMNSIHLKERKKKSRVIKNSFLGSEAIDWLQSKFDLEDREEAKSILSKLLNQSFIKHHSDKDDTVDNCKNNNNSNNSNNSNSSSSKNNKNLIFKDKSSTIYFFPIETENYPEPILPKSIVSNNTYLSSSVSMLDIHPVELARQLTLIEFNFFCKILPSDFSNQAWSKADSKEKVPNLIALINRSNTLSYWVATEILSSNNIKHRATVLKRFITIAEILFKFNNFNTLMAVILGLNLGSIQRLKKTWELLPKNMHESFQQLTLVTSERQNYLSYRKIISTPTYPCLPFMAVYLRDLTFIEENQTILDNGFVNFDKMKMIAKILIEIQRYQSVPYHLKKVTFIEDLIKSSVVLNDKDLYKASNMCEQSQRNSLQPTQSSSSLFERKKSFFQLKK